jgi:hypothetical protein
MSKNVAQPLNRGDKLIITYNDDAETTQDLNGQEIDGIFTPMYVNSNYTLLAALDTLTIIKNDEDEDEDDDSIALKIKTSQKNTPKILNGENLALNNYINGEAKYTKFNFENLPKVDTSAPELTD